MLAFVCVHARVREGVFVSPSVRLSVCLSVYSRSCSCVQMFVGTCVRLSKHAFVCVHACVREGALVSPTVRVRPSAYLSVRMHVRTSKCLFVHASIHQYKRDISYF